MPFSYSIDGEGQSELGAIYARIKIPNAKQTRPGEKPSDWTYLNVFNAHTQSSSSFSDPYILFESVKCREAQI